MSARLLSVFLSFSVLALCGLPSCDKAKDLVGGLAKKAPARPAVTYSGSLVSEIPAGSYATFPNQPGRVVIVDFHADWCGPCRKLGPILEAIANEKQGLVLVGKVNVDHNKEIAAKEGVQGIPDVRIYRDGKLVDQFVGLPQEASLRKRIEGHLAGLAPIEKAAAPAAAPGAAPAVPGPMSKDWLPPGMQRR